ncbi:MAG: hypothetical protein ABI151_01185, partial [Chitinophagaceae bacterium]
MNTGTSKNAGTDVNRWRLSDENILPQNIKNNQRKSTGYEIYPSKSVGAGKIHTGYASLANWIIDHKNVRIEGYIGIFWETVKTSLDAEFKSRKIAVKWTVLEEALKSAADIQLMVDPFLGESGSVWGRKATLDLADFFENGKLASMDISQEADLNIAIGIGASLLPWDGPIIYLDIPKNEIQYRSRAGTCSN